ncbi:MAG: nucleotidyl transferase AbiEii/AbiGii toxin family protein [Gammaproteobacteria bacterium]|nr:nucleotidyl transferase AbiEii/AbiGii toxin family protein [Gammaproteobacteria bacterium]
MAQITQRAARDDVPAPTVERDYVLAHIMAAIGKLGNDHGLVFKGGTALRLCYFRDYRYSADLDFSMIGGSIASGYAIIEDAFALVTGAVNGLNLTGEEPKRIAYQGPMGGQRSLKLDITDDEYVLNVDTIQLLPHWPDLPASITVPVYTPSEIAGEKLRCVMQRMQCRDLFDLWFLFEDADVDPYDAVEIFSSKATHRNLNPRDFKSKYEVRLQQYRRRWTDELGDHVPGQVPHFKDVERSVRRLLRGVGIL